MWLWFVLVFIIGMYLVLFIMACCKLSGEISRREEKSK